MVPSALLGQFTTPTAHIPAHGHMRVCAAATACPHIVLAETEDDADLMLADHLWEAHGIVTREAGRG